MKNYCFGKRFLGICMLLGLSFVVRAQQTEASMSIFRTSPYLQNPTGGGITVMWLTHVPVYSWVEYGTDSLHLKKAHILVDGQVYCNNYIHKIRLDSLERNKKYYYRVCSREITDYKAYSKTFGRIAVSRFYTFKLPDERNVDFVAVIFNDLHKHHRTMEALCENIKGINYDFVLFNGDYIDDPVDEAEAVHSLAFYNDKVGAAEIPVFYLRGNHEIRNAYSIHLRELFEYPGNKTYCAFNWGDTRFVFLDCGEDKPDDHRVYYGLNDFTGLRQEQTEFLRHELKSKAFRHSGKRVLVHHVPLYGNNDEYNPCLGLWGGLLRKAPFNVSLNAHTHEYAYHPKGSLGNNFPVIVGGGYGMNDATVMILKREGKLMTLKILNASGNVVGEFEL